MMKKIGPLMLVVGVILSGTAFLYPRFEAKQVEMPKVEAPFVQATPLPAAVPSPTPKPVDPIVAMDGHNRSVSKRLCDIAQGTADRMSQTNNYYLHTNLQPYTTMHGVMRENACFVSGLAVDWSKAYDEWRRSPPHLYNLDNGGKCIGYAHSSNGFNTFYVVIYAELP